MLFKRAAIRQIYEKQRFLDDRVSMLWVKITGAQALSSSLGGNWEGVEESVVLPDADEPTRIDKHEPERTAGSWNR